MEPSLQRSTKMRQVMRRKSDLIHIVALLDMDAGIAAAAISWVRIIVNTSTTHMQEAVVRNDGENCNSLDNGLVLNNYTKVVGFNYRDFV